MVPIPARILLAVTILVPLLGQEPLVTHAAVPLQPLAQQTRRIETALSYLGQPLLPTDQREINDAIADSDEIAAVKRLERVLDKYTLAVVEINPEGRVKAEQGTAKPELVRVPPFVRGDPRKGSSPYPHQRSFTWLCPEE